MGHYHVVENTPGCMPDNDPACFRSRKAAERYAASLAEELRESGCRVSGSARNGGYYGELACDDLGRVIEVVEIDGPPCQDTAGGGAS